MKKFMFVFVLMISLFAVAACSRDTETSSRFKSKDDVFGFSVLASIQGLEGLSSYSMETPGSIMTMSEHDTFEILSEIDELKPYLALVQSYLDEEQGFSVDITESDHADYEYAMTILALNMVGEYTSYVMHYNEEITDEDEDGHEVESTLTGILVIDGVTYHLYAEREIGEFDESLELTASIDDDNYITIDYEIEIDTDEYETEFLLEVYQDNQLIKMIEINFEQDEGETELDLKFYKNGHESEYAFEIDRDGNTTTIDIDYKITQDGNLVEEGELEMTIVYNETTGEHTITYTIEAYGKGSIVVEDDELNNEEETTA